MITNENAIVQEISALEQQMIYANELKKKIKEATDELSLSYLALIDTKSVFEKIKKQNLEEIRLYRHSVSSESKALSSDVNIAVKSITPEKLNQLKDLADICERLNSIRASGLFDTLKIIG